jgi:hypothetical protein
MLGRFLITKLDSRAEGCSMLMEAEQLYAKIGLPDEEETRKLMKELRCNE